MFRVYLQMYTAAAMTISFSESDLFNSAFIIQKELKDILYIKLPFGV